MMTPNDVRGFDWKTGIEYGAFSVDARHDRGGIGRERDE
jgi:hypothetical protein